jgi:hypothetical protein
MKCGCQNPGYDIVLALLRYYHRETWHMGFLYYFLQLYVNLKASQNKKFNLKIKGSKRYGCNKIS